MAKILLVDDAAFMRMMLKNTLTQAGYTDLIEAEDGVKAVEAYTAEKPDLVFMDITMPNMDGLQALKKIKESHQDAKIVMCTAMGQQSMVVEAIKYGAKDFIVKPFNADRITEAAKLMLG